MKITKRKAGILTEALEEWGKEGVLDEDSRERLLASMEVIPFDWRKMAVYSFFLALISIVIAVVSIFTDRTFILVLARLFTAPDLIKCIFFCLLSLVFFLWAFRRRENKPLKVFSNEALIFLGVLSLAGAIVFLGMALGDKSGHFSLLLLLAAILYGVIGFTFSSRQIWVFSIISLGAWFGAETGYMSGWGAYYFGMNYPMRFVVFGAVLTMAGFLMKLEGEKGHLDLGRKILLFSTPTKVMGYFYLFMALWIMSIFGNYSDIHIWRQATHSELAAWSVLSGAVSILAIWHGLRWDDRISRGFGITFLLINLYTRFFEFFWDSMHKAVFFGVLALSFWFLGSRSEKVWGSKNRGDRE